MKTFKVLGATASAAGKGNDAYLLEITGGHGVLFFVGCHCGEELPPHRCSGLPCDHQLRPLLDLSRRGEPWGYAVTVGD